VARVLYLTNNSNLGSTARILQSWLEDSSSVGIEPRVAMRGQGALTNWLIDHRVPTLVDTMPPLAALQPWSALRHAWRVSRFARGINLIHCNEHDVYPFLIPLRVFLRVPAVCHVRYRIDRGFASWAFGGSRCPEALLWTSEQQRNDSADAVRGIVPERRQHIVPLGFDVNRYGVDSGQRAASRLSLGIGDDEVVVGTASPLRPRKRVHDFIELARRLAVKHPQAVFLIAGGEIAGDEGYREQIERHIADAKLGRRLRWLGFLEPVEPFYHATDVQVSTSEYETFGNSVCEAMACARPVAAYSGGSVSEVLGDTGLVVETGDLDGLTDAVERLILDASLRATLGQAARTRVAQSFSPKKSLEQLAGIYASII